ncbi:MAG: glycosyltransferase family 9 protein [Phycisphaerae bacterium]|nr:glycosyltransferase family 9 protein [Phycisphaerae bacterium]
MPETPRRILVIKPSALGDIVHALPTLSSLRASFPDAQIAWLVRPAYASLLEYTQKVNEIILFDRKRLGRWWFSPAAAVELGKFVRTLRSRRFDCVIDLQGLLRTALFSALSGCRNRYGFRETREGAWLLYTHRITLPESCVHVIDSYWEIARAAGATIRRLEYGLQVSEDTRHGALELLNRSGCRTDAYGVLVAGSTQPWKCWPLERFARLAERMAEELELSIVAVGSEGERPLVEQLQSLSRVPIVNLAGRTDIGQLIASMASARIVVSNDTGPGHIAVASGTPTVMIFGPTNPARVGPYGHPDWIAAVDPFGRGRIINHFDPRYRIETISVDQVFEIVRRQFAKSTKR